MPQGTDILTPHWSSREQKISRLAALVVKQQRVSVIVDCSPNQQEINFGRSKNSKKSQNWSFLNVC